MSYTRKPSRVALGDLASTIANVSSAIGVAADLAADPYLPETVCRIGQISNVNKGKPPGSCAKTPMGLPGGVGLRKAIQPLRGIAYAEQHTWVYPVVIGAAIGVPMLIGYWLGKGKR